MKKKIIITALALFAFCFCAMAQSAFPNDLPQDLYFEMHGRYTRAIKKENLIEIKMLNDIIENYPTNWISKYVSVEIRCTCNGISKSAVGSNNILTKEQKDILSKSDLLSNIYISVKYKYKDELFKSVENNTINIAMTIIPEKEAEFVGGVQEMKRYVKENIIAKIVQATPAQNQHGLVLFTVNENGEIINTKISKATGDTKSDKLLIELINKMPKWKPAENSNGVKIKQEFEFSFGLGGC